MDKKVPATVSTGFMKPSNAAVLHNGLEVISKSQSHEKNGTVIDFWEIIHNLRKLFATDDVFV